MNGSGTKDPVKLSLNRTLKVEILDKDGHVIGSGKTDKTVM